MTMRKFMIDGLLLAVLPICAGSVLAADAQPTAAKSTSAAAQSAQPASKQATPAANSNDQLTLDATLVTGNRELPKVMYIVPWKKAELSNLPGQPFNTLIDETLAPVDREVFRREVDYYQVIADKDRTTDQSSGKPATPAADRK
ncbi:MAG: hypothetical protein QM808_05565 [Steroidobacteraceae bacterium]